MQESTSQQGWLKKGGASEAERATLAVCVRDGITAHHVPALRLASVSPRQMVVVPVPGLRRRSPYGVRPRSRVGIPACGAATRLSAFLHRLKHLLQWDSELCRASRKMAARLAIKASCQGDENGVIHP